MIQLTAQMRILVAVEAADFRKGIDGLAQLCRRALKSDPLCGAVFVFRSRSGKAIRILAYDGQGFWLCQKRLSSGRFRFWPRGTGAVKGLQAHELQVLLSAGNPAGTQAPPPWRSVAPGE
jgi:transposase